MKNNHVLTPSLHESYPIIQNANGVFLTDEDGKQYMDMSACPFASSLGYGRQDMAEAILFQAQNYHSAYRKFCVGGIVKKAAHKLHELTGMEKFLLVSGGSEANEVAVKIARAYHISKGNTSKHIVLGRWNSYHGGTMYTMSLAGDIGARASNLDTISENGHIPPCYCYRCWFDAQPEHCDFPCARALESEILRIGPQNISAFICETVSGSSLAAALPPSPHYFQIIQDICKKYDVLLILDEILAGSGRTGKFLAADHYGILPDILTLGKCISSAYIPAAVIGCTHHVVNTIADGYAGVAFPTLFTCANQPMSAAAILKTLEIYQEEHLIDRNAQIGTYLYQKLSDLALRHPTMGDVRGLGSLIGIEYVADKDTKALLPKEYDFSTRMMHALEDKGILLLHFSQSTFSQLMQNPYIKKIYGGLGIEKMCVGDLALLAPPYILQKEEADFFLHQFDQTLSGIEASFGF